jgi:pimeloyl-ACP methyl ester carboxylesterase
VQPTQHAKRQQQPTINHHTLYFVGAFLPVKGYGPSLRTTTKMTTMTTIMGGRVQVNEDVVMLLGWPTDIVTIHSVQHHQSQVVVDSDGPTPRPHTLLLFVPGNPGCIGWYSSTLATLVDRLGPGFAAHGVSYAGHSPHPDRTTVVASSSSSNHHHQRRRPIQVAWTIDGQVQHKIAFYDHVMNQYRSTTQQQNQQQLPHVIWLSHSIGAHLVERVLVLRKDCFKQTKGVLYLMPFVRMKADRKQDQRLLDAAAARPSLVISIAEGLLNYTISKLPMKWLESLPIMEEPKDQQLALALLRQPWFARNFFQLGTEEIRDVSEGIDVRMESLLVGKRTCDWTEILSHT